MTFEEIKKYHYNIFYMFSDDYCKQLYSEILISKKYGAFRGTGVLIFLETEWKISQYNLLLPIPNNLMKKYAAEIKNYYKQK